MRRSKKRVDRTTVACPIIYGSLAYWMGNKKAGEGAATHRWTLFVRGPNDEDLSTFVREVAFTLHPSFPEPIRRIKEAPFEVTETGWGEFESGIRIFFKDPEEQPIDLLHSIKLYHPSPQPPLNVKKPVMAEVYDEIVFTDPNEDFYRNLLQYTKARKVPTAMSEFYTVFDAESDVQQLTFVQDHILKEIDVAKARLLQLDFDISYLTSVHGPSYTVQTQTAAKVAAGAGAVGGMSLVGVGDPSMVLTGGAGMSGIMPTIKKEPREAKSSNAQQRAIAAAAASQAMMPQTFPSPPPPSFP